MQPTHPEGFAPPANLRTRPDVAAVDPAAGRLGTGARWMAACAAFADWAVAHPHTWPPPEDVRLPHGTSLRNWAFTAMHAYRYGPLPAERLQALESIPAWREYAYPPRRAAFDAARRLGARLRSLRLAANLKGSAVARLTGCSSSLITAIERGAMGPTAERLETLLALYEVSPSVAQELRDLFSTSRRGRGGGRSHASPPPSLTLI